MGNYFLDREYIIQVLRIEPRNTCMSLPPTRSALIKFSF